MKTLLLLGALTFAQFTFATTPPPAGFPIVKGEVRKVDMASGRISLKHEEIPNLNMPPMTMSFVAKPTQLLAGLAVGDKINFVADEVDGDATILWLEKQVASTLPTVKGVVRKIEAAAKRISIKHEAIPNLDMPGMTMSFQVQDVKLLSGLVIGDKIEFTAAEVDGEITILSLKKSSIAGQVASEILCKGFAPTSPKTNVEIEVRQEKFSTIRYEFAEGPYMGTAYINSIGRLTAKQEGDQFIYQSGDGQLATRLSFERDGDQITNSRFSHYSSGMDQAPVQCVLE